MAENNVQERVQETMSSIEEEDVSEKWPVKCMEMEYHVTEI